MLISGRERSVWEGMRSRIGELLSGLLPYLYVAGLVGMLVPWMILLSHHVLSPGQTYGGESQNLTTTYVTCPSPLFFDQEAFSSSLVGSPLLGTNNGPDKARAVASDCQTLMNRQTAGDTTLMLWSIPFGFLWLRVVIERRLSQQVVRSS